MQLPYKYSTLYNTHLHIAKERKPALVRSHRSSVRAPCVAFTRASLNLSLSSLSLCPAPQAHSLTPRRPALCRSRCRGARPCYLHCTHHLEMHRCACLPLWGWRRCGNGHGRRRTGWGDVGRQRRLPASPPSEVAPKGHYSDDRYDGNSHKGDDCNVVQKWRRHRRRVWWRQWGRRRRWKRSRRWWRLQ